MYLCQSDFIIVAMCIVNILLFWHRGIDFRGDATLWKRGDVFCHETSGKNDTTFAHKNSVLMAYSSFSQLSRNCSHPCYNTLQQKRPLPLLRLVQAQEEDDYDDSGGEYSDREHTFLPQNRSRSSSSSRSSTSKSSKKSTKTRRVSTQGDSDQEDAQQPLKDSVHHQRKQQRLENMAATRRTAGKKGRKSTKKAPTGPKRKATRKKNEELLLDGTLHDDDESQDSDASEDEYEQKENAQDLQLEVHRLKKRLKLDQSGSKKTLKNGTQKAMEREVKKCSKTILWKVCKFLKNEKKLDKATKYVMGSLYLTEMEGLSGKALVDAQEVWMAQWRAVIRKALNKQRNYVQQELRGLMERVFKAGKQDDFPNQQEILHLILREKLDEETPQEEREHYEKLFDNYWNVLIPKVAGHANWGPGKRHYLLLSSGREDDDNQEGPCYVTPADEAFLAVIWLNCYPKWVYQEECRKKGLVADDNNELAKTPYTNSKAGQKKFGGWLKLGMDKYDELFQAIQKNRQEESDYIEGVEQLALERIRKKEKVEEKDANRKTKKRSKAVVDDEDDDSSDEEDNFEKW